MSQLVTVKLAKPQGASWGFRLQGGKDFATPLCIQKVNAGSVAEKTGLQAGDAIVSIGGLDALAMRHKEAQDAIIKAGGNFDMVVQRGAQTWKPAVTPLAQPQQTPQGPVATKTSLHADKQESKPVGIGHNTSALPFGEINGKTIVNAQYNTPLNLYSEDSIAETLSAQAEVLGKGVLGINFKKYKKEEKILTDSPTYKLIHGLEEDSTRLPSRALQADDGIAQQTKTSFPVVRMAREQGYYNINEKLYCDVHAKQAARHNPPAPNMEPVAVKPGAMPPAGAVPSSQVKAPTPTRIQVPTISGPKPFVSGNRC